MSSRPRLQLRTGFVAAAAAVILVQTAFAADPFSTASRTGPRARVVTVTNHDATEAFRPRPEKIQTMVERGITRLAGKTTAREAWLSFVSTQDVVGLKVYSAPGPNSGTRP